MTIKVDCLLCIDQRKLPACDAKKVTGIWTQAAKKSTSLLLVIFSRTNSEIINKLNTRCPGLKFCLQKSELPVWWSFPAEEFHSVLISREKQKREDFLIVMWHDVWAGWQHTWMNWTWKQCLGQSNACLYWEIWTKQSSSWSFLWRSPSPLASHLLSLTWWRSSVGASLKITTDVVTYLMSPLTSKTTYVLTFCQTLS